MQKRPIGVYDSGVGGLTVLETLRRELPHEDFIYFGDTAHLPYGTKTPEQIIAFTRQIISWMYEDMGVKAVVAACHTSSALALESVSSTYPIPIMGMIRPLLKTLTTDSQNRGISDDISRGIGIIATPASAASQMHEKIFREAGVKSKILTIPCPDFVPMIENNQRNTPELMRVAQTYLQPFLDQHLGVLIYGCTHYPFMTNMIRSILPLNTVFINPADDIAAEMKNVLQIINLKNVPLQTSVQTSVAQGTIDFYCSSDPELFCQKITALTTFSPTVCLKNLADSFWPVQHVVNQ